MLSQGMKELMGEKTEVQMLLLLALLLLLVLVLLAVLMVGVVGQVLEVLLHQVARLVSFQCSAPVDPV
jgi:hypothetical protein